MSSVQHAVTDVLDIAYDVRGPADAPVVLLLHGWPDNIRGWGGVAPLLHAAGFRTVAPYLRGFGPTRFRSSETPRDGRGVALAHDAIALMDALGITRFAVVGHDWGARAAYILAALFPDRVVATAALALAYQPGGGFTIPSFAQSRLFWYQWFLCVDDGAAAVREDPKGFARLLWDTWSPAGWFDDGEFDATARSFENPDWADVTLHAYRGRWRREPSDSRYDALEAQLRAAEMITVPTLMIQGGDDRCDAPSTSEGQARWFGGPYRRLVLDGVGHFPAREAPDVVAAALTSHLAAASG
jgi:pimeloyl-ACP methyl ester carboxylesterase